LFHVRSGSLGEHAKRNTRQVLNLIICGQEAESISICQSKGYVCTQFQQTLK